MEDALQKTSNRLARVIGVITFTLEILFTFLRSKNASSMGFILFCSRVYSEIAR